MLPMRTGLVLLILLAASLGAPAGHAWFWDCSANPHKQECAKDPQPDVNRLFAFGRGGHHSIGLNYNGTAVREYDSCFFADLNAGEDYGQIVVAGLFNPDTAVDLRFEDFWSNQTGAQGGIAKDTRIFGSHVGGLPLPEMDVLMAGWGNATFEVNFEEYPDVVNGPPLSDEDEWNWTAMFFLSRHGIRDNATKRMTTIAGQDFDPMRPRDVRLERGDWEAHLILRNHTFMGHPWQVPMRFGGPEVSTVRDDQYRTLHVLPNWAYSGTAQVRLEVTAPTLLQTELTFELLSPSDRSLGNWTLGGTPLASDVRTFSFPLNELFEYRFRVSGTLALAQYRITVNQVGPEEALLYFWWEDFSFGYPAVREADQCRGIIHGDLMQPAPMTVHTPDPKPLALRLLVLGVAASLLVGLYVVKLVFDSVSTGSFLRSFRKG